MLEILRALDTVPTGQAPIAVVVPRGDLAAAIDQMQRSPHVVAAVFGDDAASTNLLEPHCSGAAPFGIEHVLGSRAEVHTEELADFADKMRCTAKIAAFVRGAGASATVLARIEQCLDEMLMNGLYDAPIDASGRRVFDGVPTRKRITMRTDQRVVVTYGHDGRRFAVAVRDAFGSLERGTLLRHLRKGLHEADAIDRKAGGAGLGLYLMVTAASSVCFDVVPGVMTEAMCAFELGGAAHALEYLAYFEHPTSAAKTPPARRRWSRRTLARKCAAGALVALVVAIGVIVVPRLMALTRSRIVVSTMPGAAIELDGARVGEAHDGTLTLSGLEHDHVYRIVARRAGHAPARASVRAARGDTAVALALQPLATLVLETEPSGAIVELEGAAIGTTPLTLGALAPSTSATLAFVHPGYRTASARISVPARGVVGRHVQRLEIDPDFVRVRFTSNPPGAAILRDGRSTADRTYTPADVFVEVGRVHAFTLAMAHHAPLVIAPFTPARDTPLERGGDLP